MNSKLKYCVGLCLVLFVWLSFSSFAVLNASTSTIPITISTLDELERQMQQVFEKRLTTLQLRYRGNSKQLSTFAVNKRIQSAMNALEDDLQYIIDSYRTRIIVVKNGTSSITLTFVYRESIQQTAFVDQKVRQIVQEIVDPTWSDHQKLKVIHDWTVRTLAYDRTLKSRSAYDGLTTGKTVCEGYAVLIYKMVKEAGIQVRIVEGRGRGILHAWNLVQLDRKWYHLDVTWNDPVPDQKDQINYDYYLLTDAQIRRNHSIVLFNQYPKADTEYVKTIESNMISEMDQQLVGFFEKLYDTLEYSYLEAENTIKNLNELKARVALAVDNGEDQLIVRYLRGYAAMSDAKLALRYLNQGGSYSAEPFTKGSTGNEMILTIQFK